MFVEGGTKTKADPAGTQAELGAAPIEWIEREIGELAAHIAAATCRWLELIAEFGKRGGYETWGFHSCGAWIAWRCSIDPRSAREHVRVARALEGLSLVHERFGHGELSYSKVRAITRIATPEIEAELVEMARFATAAQLERLVRGYRRAVSVESAEAAHRDRFLSCEWEEDGSMRIRGLLAPEDGALFLKAIGAGRDAIREREEADSADAQGAGSRIDDGPAICAETPRSAGRSIRVTRVTANSRVVRTAAGSMPTTSFTGHGVGGPKSTIWSCSVHTTTDSCTRVGSGWLEPPMAHSSSADPIAGRFRPLPPPLAATVRSYGPAIDGRNCESPSIRRCRWGAATRSTASWRCRSYW